MMGRISIAIFFIFVLMIIFSGSVVAGVNMKEGLWEITTQMEMPGMPMQLPPQVRNKCITKKDMVPQKTEPDQDCKWLKKDIKGDTVTWKALCQTDEGPVEFNGKVTYKGETFDGVLIMKQSDMEITNKMSGRWIGKCK